MQDWPTVLLNSASSRARGAASFSEHVSCAFVTAHAMRTHVMWPLSGPGLPMRTSVPESLCSLSSHGDSLVTLEATH